MLPVTLQPPIRGTAIVLRKQARQREFRFRVFGIQHSSIEPLHTA